MRSSFFYSSVSALLLSFSIVACSGAEDDVATGEGEDDYTAARGQTCGGFAGTRCAEGLRCNYGSRGLNTGTCVTDPNAASQGAGEGETCGGASNIQCKAGLTCKKRTERSTKGKCEAAQVTCQAIPTCDEGHQKVSGPDACLEGDAACYKRSMCGRTIWCTGPAEGGSSGGESGAGPGELCGGFAGTRCRAGLTCDNSRGINTGVCR